jgi:hypothetical protein
LLEAGPHSPARVFRSGFSIRSLPGRQYAIILIYGPIIFYTIQRLSSR